MKKILLAIVTGLFTVAMATGAMAEQKEQVNIYEQNQLVKSVVFVEGKSEYFVDGKTPGVKMDASPYISQGRTFVPVRFLGNALGVDNDHIAWDTSTNKAKLVLGSRSAELTIGKKELLANGQTKALDVAPELKNNRTFLPARFVAESLGYQVDFIDGLVVCYPEGTERPDVTVIKQYINQQVPQGETKNLNGYIVPVKPKTDLMISDDKEKMVEMDLGIIVNGYVNGVLMHNRDVAKQCDEAEQILASKFGSEFAKQVVDVARTKTTQLADLDKEFTGPNGEAVWVTSGYGGIITSITVWSKGA